MQARNPADLFGSPFLAREDWTPNNSSTAQCRQDEWELLGFLIDGPLMSVFRPHCRPDRLPLRAPLITSREVPRHVGKVVTLIGLVATARRLLTDQNQPMQFVTLEDEEGLVEVTLFPDVSSRVPSLCLGPYLVEGPVEDQYDMVTVTAARFELINWSLNDCSQSPSPLKGARGWG